MIVSIDVRAQVTYYYKFSYIHVGLGDLTRFEMITKVMISDVRLVSILRG